MLAVLKEAIGVEPVVMAMMIVMRTMRTVRSVMGPFPVSAIGGVFLDCNYDSSWRLVWMDNLDHWVGLKFFAFTEFAKVIIFADSTLVANSNDWAYVTAITSDMVVDS